MTTVNTDRVNELADFIESAAYEFDMTESRAQPQCGSAGCIGGHAAVLWREVSYPLVTDGISFDEKRLGSVLGLTPTQVDSLCYCISRNGDDSFREEFDLREITREQAVSTLRRLAATGKVSWKVLKEEAVG